MTPALHADKVAVDLATGCWLWTAALDKDGYAIVRVRRADGSWTCRKAHRVLFEHHVGPIPAKHELDHKCGARRCVRPEHVEPVLGAVNKQRIYARWLGEVEMTPPRLRELYVEVTRGTPLGQLADRFQCSKGELIGVIRSTPYRRLADGGEVEQMTLLGAPHPDDEYLPAYLR